MRVISLVPSATETLLEWGVEPIAVTRFCERPGLRAVGGTKDPDVAAIVALRPDLVVVCDQENRREDEAALRVAGLDTHVVHITVLEHVEPQMRALANRLGVDLAGWPAPASAPDPPEGAPLRAWIPIWKRPWMTINAATYGSSLLAAVGTRNVFADHPDRYPTITLEDVAARRPDVVLAPSEPYPFAERHRPQLEDVAPTVFVDGKDLFWWGTRTAGALTRLRALLAADLGHSRTQWNAP